MAQPIPPGAHTITPHLVVRNASEAIDFYVKAFGAEVVYRMAMPNGAIGHAELKIGDSLLYLADEFPDHNCLSPLGLGITSSPVSIHLYVEDAEATFKQATDAGATATMPVQKMFWGDLFGKLRDPYGHEWSIATHVEDVSPEDLPRRMMEAMGGDNCAGATAKAEAVAAGA